MVVPWPMFPYVSSKAVGRIVKWNEPRVCENDGSHVAVHTPAAGFVFTKRTSVAVPPAGSLTRRTRMEFWVAVVTGDPSG